jgi:hypothetical protein
MATLFPCVKRSVQMFLVFITVATICGCESFDTTPIKQMFATTPEITHEEETAYRERYQHSRDPEALQWLLAHCIDNGMTRAEVDGVIGQPGRFEPNDRLLKTNNNAYHTSDKMYAYGPDSKSQTYYLVFRDNRLVGFDAHDFELDEFASTTL